MQIVDIHSADRMHIQYPGDVAPSYSPAYPTALTRNGLLPGEVGEAIQRLPHSLARCIRQYQLHGDRPLRTSAARLAELQEEAERIATCLGWIDVRRLNDHEVRCIVQTSSSPTLGRSALKLVLSHAARQGVISYSAMRNAFPKESTKSAHVRPDGQWKEADWQLFRFGIGHGTIEEVAVCCMIHLDINLSDLCRMAGPELIQRIALHPHPELLHVLGGIDLTRGLLEGFRHRWLPTFTELRDDIILGCSEYGLPPIIPRDALRLLFYSRAADVVMAATQRRPASPRAGISRTSGPDYLN